MFILLSDATVIFLHHLLASFYLKQHLTCSHGSFLWLSCSVHSRKRTALCNYFYLFIFFPPVVLTQAPEEIIKYVGDTVTLSSGDKSSLSKIAWSIFSNTTIIARYQSKRTSTELFHQYSHRLSLDESTGEYTSE